MINGIVASQNTEYDPYFSNVFSLLHFNGANNSTTFTDVTGKTWSRNGSAKISTTQKKFGTASYTPSVASSGIATSFSGGMTSTQDFTIEFYIYLTQVAANKTILDIRTSGAGGLLITQPAVNPASINFYCINSDNVTSTSLNTGTISANTWYALAYTRSGNTFRVFLNGVKVAEDTQSITTNYGPTLSFGNNVGMSSSVWVEGYMDELRITKGVARYTADYTLLNREFYNN